MCNNIKILVFMGTLFLKKFGTDLLNILFLLNVFSNLLTFI